MVAASAGGRWRALFVAVVVSATLLLPTLPGLSVLSGLSGSSGAAHAEAPKKEKAKKRKAPQVWTGYPGTNLAHDSYAYPWPAAPDCNEGNVADGSCVNDGRGFFQGQCTSWVGHRVSQRNGISFTNWFGGTRWGNAADWAKVAKRLGYVRNKVPAVGAIGWYARGHVSYVEDVYSDGSVLISEMNTDGHNGFHLVTVRPGDYSWPDRFIHVADVVPVDYTAPEAPERVVARHLERGTQLSWKRSSDDVGTTGYRVLRDGAPLAETTEPAFVDRKASPGQVYDYTVRAYDAAGNVSSPGRTQLGQTVPAKGRLAQDFTDATEVVTSNGSVVCGLTGTRRYPLVGCRVRSLYGWRTVVAERQVPWGREGTRAFVASVHGTRVWFCRELAGDRGGCLPLDLGTLEWGSDRVDTERRPPERPVWVATVAGPTRCGVTAGRATCTTLTEAGWTRPRPAAGARTGDPLTRAFVPVEHGVAFCRTVADRAVCSTLHTGRLSWGRDVTGAKRAVPGRWSVRASGPVLCPVGGTACRPVARSRG